MEDQPKTLFQYRSNKTTMNIIKENAIRMSDILKSNDYMEMKMLFPDIFGAIVAAYQNNPFDIKYENQENLDAIRRLNGITFNMIYAEYAGGSFSNYVACFSENDDQLSQWRAYGDDGQGCCLGYSFEELTKIVRDSDGVLRLNKITYIDNIEKTKIINSFALDILKSVYDGKKYVGRSLVCETSEETKKLGFWYYMCVKIALNLSLTYKNIGFREENEWRLMLSEQAYKNPKFVIDYLRQENFSGTTSFMEHLKTL